MAFLRAILSLLLVVIVWTSLLFLTPHGWGSLYIAVIAVFDKSRRTEAKKRWEKDDETVNKFLGGKRHHTISGRAGYQFLKTDKRYWAIIRYLINRLFWFQKDHCFHAINWNLYPEDEQMLKAKHARLHA